MARERKSFIEINFFNLHLLSICVALVCQLKTLETKRCGFATLETLEPNYDNALPFLAALYRTDQSKFFCGGTLISSMHILTAAHCVHEKYSENTIHPDYIAVLLGAYDLTTKIEVGARQKEVKEVYVHPDWNVYNDDYNANVAILLLSESVFFSKYIRPALLPGYLMMISTVATVGWKLEDNSTDELTFRHALEKFVNDPISLMLSNDVCVHNEDESPNNVVDGGGVFDYSNSNSTWVQYGIVFTIPLNVSGSHEEITISLGVMAFKDWIESTVIRSGDTVAHFNNELICDFSISSLEFYGCFLNNKIIENENTEVSFLGYHEPGHSDEDVQLVQFSNGTMYYLPGGIGKIFKNLKRLQISEHMHTKTVTRSNLENLENLVWLNILQTDIEALDADTLWDLPSLKSFNFFRNPLKVIPERIFERNRELKYVNFKSNQLEYLPRNLFKNNLNLEDVDFRDNFLQLIEVDFTSSKNFNYIFLYDNFCIDAYFKSGNVNNSDIYYGQFRNLTEFQSLIWSNCNSFE